MALTLRGNGQITTDNFTVGSDGTTTINNDIIANKNLRLYTTDDQANQWYIYNYTDDSLRMNYNGAGSDEVILDTNGIMRKPSNPWFDAKAAGGWTSFASGENIMTSLFASGSTVYQNSGGGFNASNSTYTAPVAGRYVFLWHTYTKGGTSSAASQYCYPRLYKNGSSIHPRSLILHYTTGTNYDTGNELTILTDLAANDTIVAGFWSNSTSNQYYAAAMQLQMYFVG